MNIAFIIKQIGNMNIALDKITPEPTKSIKEDDPDDIEGLLNDAEDLREAIIEFEFGFGLEEEDEEEDDE